MSSARHPNTNRESQAPANRVAIQIRPCELSISADHSLGRGGLLSSSSCRSRWKSPHTTRLYVTNLWRQSESLVGQPRHANPAMCIPATHLPPMHLWPRGNRSGASPRLDRPAAKIGKRLQRKEPMGSARSPRRLATWTLVAVMVKICCTSMT